MESIKINDSGDCEEVPVENGNSHCDEKMEIIDDDDDVIALTSPVKENETLPLRRSSRNLGNKVYAESNKLESNSSSEESDIEEVLPQDPLAVSDPFSDKSFSKKSQSCSSTIVVKDTKRLVEIAAKSNPTNNKKEPTLVIIDTNSILSGRGPVPLSNKPSVPQSCQSVVPIAVTSQNVYSSNMRATITPIPSSQNTQVNVSPVQQQKINNQGQPILPSLTDDMFVVEAPSFIVPYVYEKPPVKHLQEFVKSYKTILQEQISKRESEEDSIEDVDNKNQDKKVENLEAGTDDNAKTSENVNKTESSPKDLTKSNETSENNDSTENTEGNKINSYFESPLGKFFIDIGYNLVQEFVQTDLLKQQKRKREREQGQNATTNKTILSLLKNLEYSKENNEHFRMDIKKCEFCSFKTESALAMAFHLETPHMKNYVYRCNFCSFEIRSPHDILFHMEAEHAVRGRLERAPAFHQCPNCPFEDNQKGKLSRHTVACARKFKPEKNLEPPVDWDPPAKIPRVSRMKQPNISNTIYQINKSSQYQMLTKMQPITSVINRGRGRPSLANTKPTVMRQNPGMVFKPTQGGSVLLPTSYQLSTTQLYQVNL